MSDFASVRVMIAALAPMFIGCAVEVISVADLDLDTGPRVRRCGGNVDCRSNEFCSTPLCGQEGVCQFRPVVCDDVAQPVCGCDGVTYWNDCIRSRTGVTAASVGECTGQASTCVDASGCPVAGASCSRLLPAEGDCDAPSEGRCWMLPADCGAITLRDRWASCDDPTMCASTCTAIRSGRVHVRRGSDSCW